MCVVARPPSSSFNEPINPSMTQPVDRSSLHHTLRNRRKVKEIKGSHDAPQRRRLFWPRLLAKGST